MQKVMQPPQIEISETRSGQIGEKKVRGKSRGGENNGARLRETVVEFQTAVGQKEGGGKENPATLLQKCTRGEKKNCYVAKKGSGCCRCRHSSRGVPARCS